MSSAPSQTTTLSFALTPQDVRRRRFNRLMIRMIQVTAVLSVVPLFAILFLVASKGLPGLNLSFLINSPLDNPSGISNAITGSLAMTFVAIIASAPVGIAGGVYLNEYASTRVAVFGDLLIDVMLGVPSILAGLFVYFALVPIIGPSGWAGALSLTVLMIPVVMRTTQEVLRLVPAGLREASLALGVPRWKTTILVTCRTALSGILTGVVLAISRGLGETAPILLTAKSSNSTAIDLGMPMNSMTVAIYNNASSSDPQLVASAWTTALVLVVIALFLNVSVRFKTINNRVI